MQLTFTLFSEKTGWRLLFGGKRFFIRLTGKALAMLVCTFLVYGGLNQMVFRGCGCVFLAAVENFNLRLQ